MTRCCVLSPETSFGWYKLGILPDVFSPEVCFKLIAQSERFATAVPSTLAKSPNVAVNCQGIVVVVVEPSSPEVDVRESVTFKSPESFPSSEIKPWLLINGKFLFAVFDCAVKPKFMSGTASKVKNPSSTFTVASELPDTDPFASFLVVLVAAGKVESAFATTPVVPTTAAKTAALAKIDLYDIVPHLKNLICNLSTR